MWQSCGLLFAERWTQCTSIDFFLQVILEENWNHNKIEINQKLKSIKIEKKIEINHHKIEINLRWETCRILKKRSNEKSLLIIMGDVSLRSGMIYDVAGKQASIKFKKYHMSAHIVRYEPKRYSLPSFIPFVNTTCLKRSTYPYMARHSPISVPGPGVTVRPKPFVPWSVKRATYAHAKFLGCLSCKKSRPRDYCIYVPYMVMV